MNEKECCANCKFRYDLEKNDYSEGGCKHSKMPGFICMIFAEEEIAKWMYGIDEDELCECFAPREVNDEARGIRGD